MRNVIRIKLSHLKNPTPLTVYEDQFKLCVLVASFNVLKQTLANTIYMITLCFFSEKNLIGIDIQSYETGSHESHELLLLAERFIHIYSCL